MWAVTWLEDSFQDPTRGLPSLRGHPTVHSRQEDGIGSHLI